MERLVIDLIVVSLLSVADKVGDSLLVG